MPNIKKDMPRYERALEKIKKCNGDCKNCEKVAIHCYGNYYGFGCNNMPREINDGISNSTRELKEECIELLETELDCARLAYINGKKSWF